MKKEDRTTASIIVETITVLSGLIYIGLQIFYGLYYHVSPSSFILNIVIALLIYVVLTILEFYPDKINQIRPEICTGKIRKLSLWMVRLIKLIFIGSLLVPCVCDALGVEIRTAWSVVVILLIIAVVVYCECKIIREIQNLQK